MRVSNAEGVYKCQPGVASTPGFKEEEKTNAESVRKGAILANAFSIDIKIASFPRVGEAPTPGLQLVNAFGVQTPRTHIN